MHAYCTYARLHYDLVTFSTPPPPPRHASTRLVVAANLCQPACMPVKEESSEDFGSHCLCYGGR